MKAEDFLNQGIKPTQTPTVSKGMSAEAFLGMPVGEPIEEPAGPAFVQGQPPTMLERGKEAVTDFFRRDPGLGPLAEEDYAAFEPADVSIPREPAVEPTTSDIPISDIEGQLPPVEPIDPTLAMVGLTPEEAAMGRPISTVTGKPVPTPEEEAAGGKAAMAIIPYGFASAVRGMVPGALERAVMDPLTQAIVGKEYVSPIDEALKIGKYLPEEGQMAIGAPAHMAGAIVPLSASFKTAGAIMKAVGLPPDLVLRTGPVMDRITAHVARGGIAGAVYGGLEGGTPQDMAEDAAFFGALEGGLGAVGGIFRKIFSANWYRNLEVKERGLVVQSLDDMLARGYSEGEILKQWNNPMWREEALARRVVGEPPPEPAAPGLSETQRDLAKEVIREELAKQPAPVPAIPERQIPLVPPGMPPPVGPPPTGPAPGVLPPGQQGFELVEPEPEVRLRPGPRPRRGPEYPEGAEYVAGRPAPEELAIEHKPVLSTRGLPWKEERNALSALKSREDVSSATHKVVKVKKGYGIVPFADKRTEVIAKAKPEEVKGKTLIAFVRAMGGIRDATLPGEIRALSSKETGVVGLTTSKTDRGLGFDEMAAAAVEHGWLPEGLEDEAGTFSEMLRDDVFAQKEKKPRIERLADVAEKTEREERWKEFERAEDAELEYFAKHPDEEIDADLDQWQRETVEEIRRRNEANRARKIEESIASKVEAENSDLEGLKKDEGFTEYIEGWNEKDLLGEEVLAELAAWRAGEEVEEPVEKPRAVPEKKPVTEPAMSPELKELHDHKARTLGFEKAGGSFVEGYLKKLAKVAEKTDMSAATAAYSALSEYKKGNINQASLEAEKILGKLHKAEEEALMPKPKVEPKIKPKVEPKVKIEKFEEITAEMIRAELPETVRKLPAGRITGRDLDGAAKALGIRRDTAFTVLKEAEPKKPIAPVSEKPKAVPRAKTDFDTRNEFYAESARKGWGAQADSIMKGDVAQLAKDVELNRISPEDVLALAREAESKGITTSFKVKQLEGRIKPKPEAITEATSYDEMMEWIEEKAKEYDGKNKFYASPEYAAVYPVVAKIKAKQEKYLQSEAEKAMAEMGVVPGDRVEYVSVMVTGIEAPVQGNLYLDKKGIPKVKTDEGKVVAWNKGWKKIPEEPVVEKAETEKPFEPDLAAMPLEKITVKTKAIRAATGETVTTKENAKEALVRIDDEIAKYKKLLECL